MPIRFRCQHCRQLLGISRRKAGMTVHCPTCRAEVTVPLEDELPQQPDVVQAEQQDESSGSPSPAPPALFERDDFEELLQGAVGQSELIRPRSGAVQMPAPVTRPSSSSMQSDVVVPPPLPRLSPAASGLLLTPKWVTVLTVVVIVLLALAFGSGLLIGRFVL